MGIQILLSDRYNNGNATRPTCVILDVKMRWCRNFFLRNNVPIFGFISSGAVDTAMMHAACKANANDMKPGETRILPGLPDCMALTYSDIIRPYQRGPNGLTKSEGNRLRELHCLGERGDYFKAFFINTCHQLEGPFLDYLANQVETPVFGIGPLLPETYWRSTETLICRDRDCRPSNGTKSNHKEDEILQWLDSKPSQSVIYISFGSKVGGKNTSN
ncbi:UDP-glucosyl transferase 73B2-like [Henckelia pumila]|uniref:UDP-glucosyl transferase 73B2-like n=1 Tax=Henckelia pumila TaxID=405737 RepID=UPI003C6E1B38